VFQWDDQASFPCYYQQHPLWLSHILRCSLLFIGACCTLWVNSLQVRWEQLLLTNAIKETEQLATHYLWNVI
jgi:hypothetical protein